MPLLVFQISAQVDSAFPRDRIVNVMAFNDTGLSFDSDPNGLATDLAAIFDQYWYVQSPKPEILVKAYRYNPGERLGLPEGQAKRNAGGVGASALPRELALCLSFDDGTGRPRYRGRIYLPVGVLYSAAGLKPTNTQMQDALNLVDRFAGLGGPDVDWNVWSRADQTFHHIERAWVDNEWDIQRRRGLRSDARLTKSTSG